MLAIRKEAEIVEVESEIAHVALTNAKMARYPVAPSRLNSSIAAAKPFALMATKEDVDTIESRGGRTDSSSSKEGKNTAFGLLEDVKRFIPILIKENEGLRSAYDLLQEKSRSEVCNALDQAREWQSVADDLTAEVITLEAMVVELKNQLQKAEGISAVNQNLVSKASQDAAEAECLSKLFEDTIISSFGIGTMFQEALSRISNSSPT